MAVQKPPSWRILAIYIGSGDGQSGLFDGSAGTGSGVEELSGSEVEFAQIHRLRSPTLQAIKSILISWRPNIVYIAGPLRVAQDNKGSDRITKIELYNEGAAPVFLDQAFNHLFNKTQYGNNPPDIHAVYLDAPDAEPQANQLQHLGIPHIISWPANGHLPALPAAQFARVFFASLRTSSVTIPEAFAIAQHASLAHLSSLVEGEARAPLLPVLDSIEESKLPDNSTVPLPVVEGMDFSHGVGAVVEGWSEVRLLAPRAELHVLLAGSSSLIGEHRLGHLGEALRAVVVLEVRTLQLVAMESCWQRPTHIPANCDGLRCSLRTHNGAKLVVVLACPPAVARYAFLVEHALRQTLVADALSVQFRLPNREGSQTMARSSQNFGRGLPAVDTVVSCPLWAVMVLRSLAQDRTYRGLITLGVVGVGNAPIANVTNDDYTRFYTIITGIRPDSVPSDIVLELGTRELGHHMSHPTVSGAGGGTSHTTSAGLETSVLLDTPEERQALRDKMAKLGYVCNRPSIRQCTESELTADLLSFTALKKGKKVEALSSSKFPDAILNGTVLDLYNLYREVCNLGGFRMGRMINWKGQVFPKLKNWTEHNKMTGVGNALKRHYANYLLEYEVCHPEDVATPN